MSIISSPSAICLTHMSQTKNYSSWEMYSCHEHLVEVSSHSLYQCWCSYCRSHVHTMFCFFSGKNYSDCCLMAHMGQSVYSMRLSFSNTYMDSKKLAHNNRVTFYCSFFQPYIQKWWDRNLTHYFFNFSVYSFLRK
jgi:hypothetical protein